MEEIFERIRAIIADQLDIDEDKITMESNMSDDFEADSLDLVDIIMTCEDDFAIEIPDEVVTEFVCVGDLVKYIEENT